MVKTIQSFSVCHEITNSHSECVTEINNKHLGVEWYSASWLLPSGSLFTNFYLIFTSINGRHQESMKITVTLTNKSGEQFVETYTKEASIADYSYDADKVGRGEEMVAATLTFDVEVTGVFPKQEKPKTRDFSSSDPVLNDVVLVAEGQKFHVNKAILRVHSSYFQNLLATGKSEYKLPNITPKVLQELLQVLYHVPEIYDGNVDELLEAARQLDVPMVTTICVEYLEGSTSLIVEEEKKKLIRECDQELQTQERQMVVDARVQENLDNVVLKVEDQRFCVSKAISATHSSYFYTMFFGGFRESRQSEIELKDIDPETFQQLLEILYHCPDIHENNVEALLDLNMIYDAQPVFDQCKKFLNGDNDLSIEEKQRLIEEYFPK